MDFYHKTEMKESKEFWAPGKITCFRTAKVKRSKKMICWNATQNHSFRVKRKN